MSLKTIKNDLPKLYEKFLPTFFNQHVPEETFATCSNCAMVCHDEKKIDELVMRPFLPDRKCCTYYPGLPNYLVGGLLSDTDTALEEGRKRIRKAIETKIGITPYGVMPPRKYSILYSNQSNGFGHSRNLLCPYYHQEEGNCTIWKYRETVCSTYYCKTIAGDRGKAFWNSLNMYLQHIQDCLCKYVLLEHDFDSADMLSKFSSTPPDPGGRSLLAVEDLDGLPPKDDVYQKMWKDWENNEEAFYKKTYEMVKNLTQEEFDAITGVQQKVLLKDMENKRSKMIDIPDILMLNPKQKDKLTDKDTFKVHYEKIDISFDLPKVIFEQFDGAKPYKKVQQILDERENFEIEEDLILSLYQYNILIEKE